MIVLLIFANSLGLFHLFSPFTPITFLRLLKMQRAQYLMRLKASLVLVERSGMYIGRKFSTHWGEGESGTGRREVRSGEKNGEE